MKKLSRQPESRELAPAQPNAAALTEGVNRFLAEVRSFAESHPYICESGKLIAEKLQAASRHWEALFALSGNVDDLSEYKQRFEAAIANLMPQAVNEQRKGFSRFLTRLSRFDGGEERQQTNPSALLQQFTAAIESDIATAEQVDKAAGDFLASTAAIINLFQEIIVKVQELLADPQLDALSRNQLATYQNSLTSAMKVMWQVGSEVQILIAANAKAKLIISNQLRVAPAAQGSMMAAATVANHTEALQATVDNAVAILDDTLIKLTSITRRTIQNQARLDARQGDVISADARANAQDMLSGIRETYQNAFETEKSKLDADLERLRALEQQMRESPQDILQIMFANPIAGRE
jgi:hypothetical protein